MLYRDIQNDVNSENTMHVYIYVSCNQIYVTFTHTYVKKIDNGMVVLTKYIEESLLRFRITHVIYDTNKHNLTYGLSK